MNSSIAELSNYKEKLSRNYEREEPTPGCYVKSRHVLAVMLFFATFNLLALRVNVNVAIVAMVNSTHSATANVSSNSCPDHETSNQESSLDNVVFDWDHTQQGLVLGCYFYGYIFTGIAGGYLANRYGAKPVIGTSMFLSSIITLLIPTFAKASFSLFVASRILLGCVQGVIFPSMQAAWGSWAPPMERTYLISSSFSGTAFGTFTTLLAAGIMAENVGWEGVFYVTGGGALMWSCVWFGIIHSRPQNHRRISIQEKTYIVESIGMGRQQDSKRPTTPWFAILTSLPVWAINVSTFCSLWGAYTLLTMLPTYMATVLRFNLSESGELSAVPYILSFFSMLGAGYMSDVLRQRKIMSTAGVRKLNTTLALAVPAALIVLAGYVGCNFQAAVAFFSLAVAFNSMSAAGFESNAIDLTPQFSGVVYGIANTFGNIPGFLAPQIVGIMLQNDGSINQWRNVFWMTAGIFVFGALFYIAFGSAEEQKWVSDEKLQKKEYSEVKMNEGD